MICTPTSSLNSRDVDSELAHKGNGADAVELTQELVSQSELAAFFELYDTDASGGVEMEELLEMVASFKQVDSGTLNQAKIKQVWDADGDGTVRCVGVLCELVE